MSEIGVKSSDVTTRDYRSIAFRSIVIARPPNINFVEGVWLESGSLDTLRSENCVALFV